MSGVEIINQEKVLSCDTCKKVVTPKVGTYSAEKFGKILCFDHQKEEKKKQAETKVEKTMTGINRRENLQVKTIRTMLSESCEDFDKKVNAFKNQDDVNVKFMQTHVKFNPEARNFNYFAVVFYEKKK